MKNKIVKAGLVLMAAIVLFGVAEKNGVISLDELAKTKAYVHITEDGVEEKSVAQSGEEFSRYVYETDSYTKDGVKRKVIFSASKNLKKDAYLVVYLMSEDENGVSQISKYEEVKLEDVPEKAEEKLTNH